MSAFAIGHLLMMLAIPVLAVVLIVLLVQYHRSWSEYRG